jgi:hypothetical protein
MSEKLINIDINEITLVGSNLNRPECVLANASGRLFMADWRGGVAVLEPDGNEWLLLARGADFEIKPNGICLLEDGSFLLTHLGAEEGGVYHLSESGELTPFLIEINGEPLPPTNYIHLDRQGRYWITVSTRLMPRAKGYRPDNADGYVILLDNQGARIVADNLGYTNECVVHPDGKRLYVNETFIRKLTAFDITEQGELINKQTIAEFGAGTYPDGLTFDAEGGVWITSIISNRVIRVGPDGQQQLVLEDNDPAHVAWVETAFQAGEMNRPHLDNVKSQRLQNISSLAFGGADLRTGYLGCLLGKSLASFKSPIAGHPPSHWHFSGPKRPDQL